MKFKLSTAFLSLTIVCLAFGWLWERRSYQEQLQQRVDEQSTLESVLSAAFYTNSFCLKLQELKSGKGSELEFEEFRRQSLANNIIYLFLNEDSADDRTIQLEDGWRYRTNQSGRILDQAGRSMELLEFNSAKQLAEFLTTDDSQIEWFGDELFTENEELKPEFVDFIERALEHYQTQYNTSLAG